MLLPAWREEAIDTRHDRKNFDCGQDNLNNFIARYARQSHENGTAKTYCAVAEDKKTILGFYTINPGQVELHRVPTVARPGSRHALSGFRLARLAVAKAYQGQGLGGDLLAHAAERCIRVSAEVGGTALLIDAKNESGAAWYQIYGAVPLTDMPLSLVLSYAEFNKARVKAGLLPI